MYFLHEDSNFFKYASHCERDLCMFKHRKEQKEHEHTDPNDKCNEVIDIIEIESEAEGEMMNDKSEICDNDSDRTFHNPSREPNTLSGQNFKCNKCD